MSTQSSIDRESVYVRTFDASETGARDGICSVMRDLAGLAEVAPRLDEIQISLAEAVNNIVEHSYANRKSGPVTIRVSFDISVLNIEIEDEGAPFPGGGPPAGGLPPVTGVRSDLPEGGFGWFLIRRLASGVRYDRQNGKNLLNLRYMLGLDSD